MYDVPPSELVNAGSNIEDCGRHERSMTMTPNAAKCHS